jgi:hypothetical protein
MHRFHHANLNLGDIDTAPTANLLGVPCVWQRICTCYDGTPEEIVNANLHTRIDLHRCDKEPTRLVATAKEAAIPRGKKPLIPETILSKINFNPTAELAKRVFE